MILCKFAVVQWVNCTSARTCAVTTIIGRELLKSGKENPLNMAVTAVFQEIAAPMMLMSVFQAYGAQAYLLDNSQSDTDFSLPVTSKAQFGSRRAFLL